jgi:hypothetical protein
MVSEIILNSIKEGERSIKSHFPEEVWSKAWGSSLKIIDFFLLIIFGISLVQLEHIWHPCLSFLHSFPGQTSLRDCCTFSH